MVYHKEKIKANFKLQRTVKFKFSEQVSVGFKCFSLFCPTVSFPDRLY